MTHHIIAQLFNSVFLMALGITVILKNNKKEVNLTFALHCFAGSFWTFAYAQMCLAQAPEQGLFWARWLHLGAIPIPVFFLHFNLALLEKSHEKRRLLSIAYGICVILLILLPTPYFVSHTKNIVGFRYFVGPAGLQYHLFTLFFAACILYGLFHAYQGIRRKTGFQRNQLKYVFIASLVGYSGGAVTFFPLFGYPTPKYSLYLISLFNLTIAFSIVRYRLFDIEVILKKVYYHFAVFLLTTAIFWTIYFLFTRYDPAPFKVYYLFIMICTSFLTTYLVHHYRDNLDRIAENAINHKRRTLYANLQKIPDRLKTLTDATELFDFLCTEIIRQLNVSYTAAYHLNQSKTCLNKIAFQAMDRNLFLPDEIPLDDPILAHLTHDFLETEVARYALPRNAANAGLIEHIDHTYHASLFIPVFIQKNISGIVCIGYHRDRMGYTDRELLILRNIGIQASLVLENITLYDQVIRENRLQLIGTMAASLAHEIRNPLTAIRTFVEMLARKQGDPDFMERFNRLVPHEVDRLLELTNSILRFTQNHEPTIEPIAFQSLFDKSLALLKDSIMANRNEILLSIRGDDTVYADADQFLQVMLNLLLNAIQASPEQTKILVELDNTARTSLRIIDHGCGIAPQNLERIFEPFYSSKIYGTGLGLANCRRIIEAHHGRLTVESVLNKGSVFTITLPKPPIPA